MYQHQQQMSLDQASFQVLVQAIREAAATGRVYEYGNQVLSENQYQNQRMVTMVQTTMELFAARSAKNKAANAQQLLQSIAQQVVSVMVANLVKRDANIYSQLLPLEKAQVDADAVYAQALDVEVESFKQAVAESQASGQPLNQSGPRTSGRFKNRNYATQSSVSMDMAPPTPTPSVDAPNVPGHISSRFAANKPAAIKKEPLMTAAATELTNAIAFNPNKQSVTKDGLVISKDDPMYESHVALIRSQITPLSTTRPHVNALEILAAGLAFNPLTLKTAKELATATEEEVNVNQEQLAIALNTILHHEEPFLALGPSHASLQYMIYAQDIGVDLTEQVFSYDYRDMTIIKVLNPDEAKNDESVYTNKDLKTINSYVSLIEWLGWMINSEERLDRDMANLINRLATTVVNEYLYFNLESSLAIDDFFTDCSDLLALTEKKYPHLHKGLIDDQQVLVDRVTDQLVGDLSTEHATMLNRWTSIKSPTLRGRVVGTSCWRAAMHIPANAVELGLEIIQGNPNKLEGKWAYITKDQAPTFFKAADDFLRRLKGTLFCYESISIYTQDGYEYRLRECRDTSKIAVSLMPRI